MANKNISDLPAASVLTSANLFEVEQGGVNGQATAQQLIDLIAPVGAGSPVGVLTPVFIGQNYSRTSTPPELWRSTGLTNADWTQLI
jgi:hypothetical protein